MIANLWVNMQNQWIWLHAYTGILSQLVPMVDGHDEVTGRCLGQRASTAVVDVFRIGTWQWDNQHFLPRAHGERCRERRHRFQSQQRRQPGITAPNDRGLKCVEAAACSIDGQLASNGNGDSPFALLLTLTYTLNEHRLHPPLLWLMTVFHGNLGKGSGGGLPYQVRVCTRVNDDSGTIRQRNGMVCFG